MWRVGTSRLCRKHESCSDSPSFFQKTPYTVQRRFNHIHHTPSVESSHSTMSSSSYLEIDWRNAPKTEQIMSDIRRLLVKCDAESEVRLRLESQNKEGVISLQQKNGTRMLMRRDHQVSLSLPARYPSSFATVAFLCQQVIYTLLC